MEWRSCYGTHQYPPVYLRGGLSGLLRNSSYRWTPVWTESKTLFYDKKTIHICMAIADHFRASKKITCVMRCNRVSIQDRNRVRDHVLLLAASDPRVVAGAVVGSLALDDGDRYSDIDLTFGVAEEFSIDEVLEDWTRSIMRFSTRRTCLICPAVLRFTVYI